MGEPLSRHLTYPNIAPGVIAVDAIRARNDLHRITVGNDQPKLGVSEESVLHLSAIEKHQALASTILDGMDMFLAEVH